MMQQRSQMMRLLKSTYEHHPDSVFVLDADHRIHYANHAARDLVGLTEKELHGKACYDALFSSAKPCDGCLVSTVVKEHSRIGREAYVQDLNGAERYVQQEWFPVLDDDGSVAFVVDVTRDVTELRHFEQALDEARSASAEIARERNIAKSYIDVSASVIIRVDLQGRVELVNRAGLELLGLPEEDVLGHDVREFVPDSVLPQLPGIGGPAPDLAFLSAMGDVVTVCEGDKTIEWQLAPVFDDGRIVALVASGLDVTARTAALSESQFRLRILEESTDTIVVHHSDGSIVYANQSFLDTVKASLEELQAMPPFKWVAPQFFHEISLHDERTTVGGREVFESALRATDGTITPVEVHSLVLEWNGRPVMASSGRDISERKAAEATIARMAFYDSLTGLANRQLFNDRLAHALTTSRRDEDWLALLFLDIDHFKAVNDTLGHRFGDALLVKVAERLLKAVRDSDTVARLGGDEFTIIFESIGGPLDAAALGSKLLRSLDEPFFIEGERFVVTASAGISLTYAGESDADTLLLEADTAMYRAKEGGRNGFRLFEPQMREAAKTRFNLKNALPEALRNKEFEVYYQPQYAVSSRELTGVEALVRWNHPTGGVLAPQHFLAAAEESGFITELGLWVLQRACEDAAGWQLPARRPVQIAVNLSARQFEDPKLGRVLEELLLATGLPADRLELEITESVAMRDAAYLRTTFQRLRSLGVRIAIDDFGTGFSSLDQLMRLEVDTLKLDRRFVSDLTLDSRAAAISSAVIYLGRSLGLRVVAEGVEHEEHLTFLAEHECDQAQGYLLARPMPAADFTAMLLEHEPFGA